MRDGCLHQDRLHEHIGGNHETVREKQNGIVRNPFSRLFVPDKILPNALDFEILFLPNALKPFC